MKIHISFLIFEDLSRFHNVHQAMNRLTYKDVARDNFDAPSFAFNKVRIGVFTNPVARSGSAFARDVTFRPSGPGRPERASLQMKFKLEDKFHRRHSLLVTLFIHLSDFLAEPKIYLCDNSIVISNFRSNGIEVYLRIPKRNEKNIILQTSLKKHKTTTYSNNARFKIFGVSLTSFIADGAIVTRTESESPRRAASFGAGSPLSPSRPSRAWLKHKLLSIRFLRL